VFPRRPPGSLVLLVHEESEAAMAADEGMTDGTGVPGGDGAEVAEDSTQVVEYAAAIDVAKGSGMVCTRVPGSRADRRRQQTWAVAATFTAVTALMDRLRCEGIQRLVLESTSDYWRIWYYLAEAAELEVWLVNARDVKHLPGRGKSDKADCVWLCKLNERGMLRRSLVPPEGIRDLRSLTRTRSRLAQDQARHRARVEKIGEDALLKISVVISDLFRGQRAPVPGRPGRRGAQPGGAGRARRHAAQGHPAGAGGRADRPVPRHPRVRDQDAPAADRRGQRRDRPAGRGDRAAARGHPACRAVLHRLRAGRRRAPPRLRR
jgi:hypothetical protein